jgi:GT2 family glycosyltransferase
VKEKVCVVLVNFKGHSDTIECLESLFKSTYSNYQVIVVDNSPGDESLQKIMDWAEGKPVSIATFFPNLVEPHCAKPVAFQYLTETDVHRNVPLTKDLVFMKSPSNRGFAGGNNLGMKAGLRDMATKYFWLLNNDTVVEPTTLETLLTFAEQTDAGMIGSKLLYYSNPGFIQAVGGRYNSWLGRGKEIGRNEPADWSKPFTMDYIVGASMFVKRECLEDVGPMNESLFLYFEELDWAVRAKRKKWSLGYCPAVVYHKIGASTKASTENNSEIGDFYSARNRIVFALAYCPWTLITLYPSFILFIFNRIRRKQFDRIKMLFKIMINPHQHYKDIYK